MIGDLRRRSLVSWLGLAVLAVALAACRDNPTTTVDSTSGASTATSALDLQRLECPSDTTKAIVSAVRTTIYTNNDEGVSSDGIRILCIQQLSGHDLVLEVKYLTSTSTGPPDTIFVGPDAPGSLAQLEATLGPGLFTSVAGVGDSAASVAEKLDGRPALTLYVQRGALEFHITMQRRITAATVRVEERQIALLLLPQLAAPAPSASASVDPNSVGTFVRGDYAASLLTTDELSTALGRPALPLTANGGVYAIAPGIAVSNAYTNAKDGSARLDIQIYRAPTAAAARTYLTTVLQPPGATPDSNLAGLGDSAYGDRSLPGAMYVLGGREVVHVQVQGNGLSADEAARATKAVAAIIAPRLLH